MSLAPKVKPVWPPSAARGLKQFDRVSRRIIQHDFRSARAGQNVTAETHLRLAQSFNLAAEVIDVDDDAIPAARLRLPSVQHRFCGAPWPKRRAQHHYELAPRPHR